MSQDKKVINAGFYIIGGEGNSFTGCISEGHEVGFAEIQGKDNEFTNCESKDCDVGFLSKDSKNMRVEGHVVNKAKESLNKSSAAEKVGAFLGAATAAATKVLTN